MKASIITSLITLFSLSAALPAPGTSRNNAREIVDRSVEFCYDDQRCDYNAAIGCANYLINLGTQSCDVGSSPTSMVKIGNCYVYGSAAGGASSASSYCRDVGYAVRNIADTCSDNGGLSDTAGSDYAGGNGYFRVELHS